MMQAVEAAEERAAALQSELDALRAAGGGGAAAAPLIDFGAPAPAVGGGDAGALQAENAKLQEMLMDLRAREAMLKAELMEARDTMHTTIAAAPAAAEEGGAKKLMGKMKMGFGKK